MKITIETEDLTVSMETKQVEFPNICEDLKGLFVAAGFHPLTVNEEFTSEVRWRIQYEEEK